MSDDVIAIESTRAMNGASPACLLRWGPREWYASVEAVRRTAEDLFTCAAYADMIGELLRIELPPNVVGGFTTAMLAGRRPRYFGSPDTVFLLPVGSSSQGRGAVALGRHDHFHRGRTDGLLLPDEARAMGRVWLQGAEAAEADTLFGAVIQRAGWMTEVELDALFGLLSDIRSGDTAD